jgi:hypothetical protein
MLPFSFVRALQLANSEKKIITKHPKRNPSAWALRKKSNLNYFDYQKPPPPPPPPPPPTPLSKTTKPTTETDSDV